ncbi:phage tail protein [Pedobacter nyackensis]|uniref:Fibronectin type-III domain-containing protein n=1 Tax=Pedobacter nyackensis TaxID=475255 RepID=A0A1W1ZYX7_9SPHI|nr:fibronectin type III domain-containing protein [Pedobacter nyackensis]SMC53361.1 hypothetical protein SAMN04488101_101150 [Pedobacter nyackensis]
MSDLIFPDNAEPVAVPDGTEKIFAARQSDGKIIYFTGTQLFASLLKLKTINNQSLIGTGNLTIVGGGGGGPAVVEPWAAGMYGVNVPVRHKIGETSYLFVSKEADNEDEPVLPTSPAWIQTDFYNGIISWSGSFPYNEGSWVTGDANSKIYESKVDGNTGNIPSGGISNEYWKYIGNYVGFYFEGTFDKGDVVIVSAEGSRIYVSNIADNQEPITSISSPGKWDLIGPELSGVFEELEDKVDKAVYDVFVAANTIALAAKADLEGGKLKPEQAIDAKLSDAQFEQQTVEGVPQDITVKESWLTNFILSVGAAQGWSGLPALGTPALTFGTSTSSQNVLNWTRPTNGVSSTVQALISGTWTTIYTGTDLTYTHTGLTASTSYDYRVKATASGYADSPYGTGSKSTLAESGGGYVVENTYLINFGSEFGSNAPAPFNNMRPAASLLQTINGFTSPVLVDDLGVSSLITVKNSGAFGGASGQISVSQNTAGNTGAFNNVVVNTGWTINGGTNAALLIDSLNASKFYEIGFLMPKDAADSVRGVTIGGVVKNRDATGTNLQSFGLAANGLDDPQFIVFLNLTGVTSVSALIKRVSGDYGAFISMMYIRVSNVAKP